MKDTTRTWLRIRAQQSLLAGRLIKTVFTGNTSAMFDIETEIRQLRAQLPKGRHAS